jgi:hypothetical protein
MTQKVKQQGFLKYLWLLNILKKLRYGHLLGQETGSSYGSGSGPRRLDSDPTKKVRIRIRPKRSGFGSDQKGPDSDPTKKVRIRPNPDTQH